MQITEVESAPCKTLQPKMLFLQEGNIEQYTAEPIKSQVKDVS